MKKVVAVALSGGIDSAVAATLLKEQGCEVVGLHFLTGYETFQTESKQPQDDTVVQAVHRMAERIRIPLEVIDLSEAFQHHVVRYFAESYREGLTPNPCVVCNRHIKFGRLIELAGRLGAHMLATGHYARIGKTALGRPCLLKGVDPGKEQSYFLARLSEQQLDKAVFPLGAYTKAQVRQIAGDRGYAALARAESQELCFIGRGDYKVFLSDLAGIPDLPGPIINTRGIVLGYHAGLHAFTIGQRRGIGIPGPEPYYVLRLVPSENTLVIGTRAELASRECRVAHLHWIGTPPATAVISVKTRIRYRHREAASTVTRLGGGRAKVTFAAPQDAITPGQAAVFYEQDRVIGTGWIER